MASPYLSYRPPMLDVTVEGTRGTIAFQRTPTVLQWVWPPVQVE